MENQYIEMNENKENTTKKRMKLNIVSNNENETISSKRKGECCQRVYQYVINYIYFIFIILILILDFNSDS